VQVFLTGVPGLNQPPHVKPAEYVVDLTVDAASLLGRLEVLAAPLGSRPSSRNS
jgi:hypothetical protein